MGSEQISGATAEGTKRFAERAGGLPGRYSGALDLTWSGVGIGTYLGAANDATDTLVTNAAIAAIRGGINVIDTAANYRGGRGEASLGKALSAVFKDSDASRDELILCTKAGYLPTSGDVFKETYVGKDGITEDDLVGGNHCLHPAYLSDRIDLSRKALGVDKLDVFYLHNPEAQLAHVARDVFDNRLKAAFEVLEQACRDGRIGCYGVATWRAFRLSPGEPGYISISGIKGLAKVVVGDQPDNFKCVQMPLALTMPEALNRPTQWIGDVTVPAVAAARLLGLAVVTSGSIGQAKGPEMNENLKKWLGEDMSSDAQRALQFTRSVTGVTSVLVGMKQGAHVVENLDVFQLAPLPRARLELMFRNKPV